MRYKYTVGTSETGGYINTTSLKDAKAEAKAWARSVPGEEVNIYLLDKQGEIIDTLITYQCPPNETD